MVSVTGAASGIGKSVAVRFGAEGARVVLADRAGKALEDVRAAGAPDGWAAGCDVSDEDQVRGCVEGAFKRFGQLDIIVNKAGLMTFKPLTELGAEDWLGVLRIGLLGAFFFIKCGFLHMKPSATMVNVSSIHALETEPMVAPYAAVKAALVSLTRSAGPGGRTEGHPDQYGRPARGLGCGDRIFSLRRGEIHPGCGSGGGRRAAGLVVKVWGAMKPSSFPLRS